MNICMYIYYVHVRASAWGVLSGCPEPSTVSMSYTVVFYSCDDPVREIPCLEAQDARKLQFGRPVAILA